MFAIDYEDLGHASRRQHGTQVTLEIDGVTVTVPEGTSVMRAAALAGVKVPKLCATDTLKAFGSCRLCLVEIEGRKGYPGLVHDDGRGRHEGPHAVREARRSCAAACMELYVSDHPLECDDLPGQRPLRAAGHGRQRRRHREASLRPIDGTRCIVRRRTDDEQSVFRLQPRAVHRLLALRARVR